MAIELHGLTKTYGTGEGALTALDGVDLRIPDGSVFGIIGQSGAGKSTLIRCINLLERPTSGTIIVGDADITTLSGAQLREARKKIGMIFQSFNLLSSRTVSENIAFPLELSGWTNADARARVEELLELVGLSEKRDQYPSQLSGGQKQRVGIARALANRPDVLLSDEATSALDPQTTNSILELLRDINEKLGLTIVLITHEMNVIKEICDYVAVIEKGRIVEQGTVLDIFTAPREQATRDMLCDVIGVDLPERFAGLDFHKVAVPGSDVLLRLQFFGDTAAEPVISGLIRRFDVDVNILVARIDHIRNVPYGTLVIELSGDVRNRMPAINYLKALNLKVEVISYVTKNIRRAV